MCIRDSFSGPCPGPIQSDRIQRYQDNDFCERILYYLMVAYLHLFLVSIYKSTLAFHWYRLLWVSKHRIFVYVHQSFRLRHQVRSGQRSTSASDSLQEDLRMSNRKRRQWCSWRRTDTHLYYSQCEQNSNSCSVDKVWLLYVFFIPNRNNLCTTVVRALLANVNSRLCSL